MTREHIPELVGLIEQILNFDKEDISDKKVIEPIQKELKLQMDSLQREQNHRAFEKLEWLYQFNEWYINQDSEKFSFYRS
jgi:hypothetical protein